MSAWPDAPAVRAFLTRASRRLGWIAAAENAAVGLGVAFVIALVLAVTVWRDVKSDQAVFVGLALAAAGIALGTVVSIRRRRPIAQLVEHRAPRCRNVVVTAAELIDRPARVRPYVGELVCREAARAVSALDPATLFPARRALIALGTTTALWVLAIVLVAGDTLASPASSAAASETIASAVIDHIDVTVTPPAYSEKPTWTSRDPARIEGLAGSRIHLTVRAAAASVAIETIGGRQTLGSLESQTFAGEVVADADGYIAIEPAASNGRVGVRRLIGLSVTADQGPRVRVTAPRRDLLLPDAKRTIDLSIEADDDLALASLTVRYTKVSGSGEQFTFTDGELPLEITRVDQSNWKARGVLRLDALSLAAGDMVVYRGVATDRRPGGVPSESDSYIIEIAAPGAVAMEGFSVDENEDKYALSQQMVILKTERLIARAPSMQADSMAQEARTIASEQRSVRAEFVFMMGGELAEEILAEAGMGDLNEEAHAEADDEVIAGRLANRGRLDLLRAIRSMSRASTALNASDLTRALTEEKVALTNLQRAFSRTRYILRALTQRERLDLSRRLTGTLTGIGRDLRPAIEAEVDPRVTALRRALSGIAGLAGGQSFSADAAERASMLAQSVLQVDPSAEPFQQVAARLNEAATAIGGGRTDEARTLLDRAAIGLAALVRANLVNAPARASSFDLGRLEGALADALRQRVPR